MRRLLLFALVAGIIGCVSERSEGPVAPEVWQQVFGGEGLQEVYCVTACSDGGFVAAGYSAVSGEPGDLYAFKMNASGELVWDLLLSSDGYDAAQSIVATDDGGYVIWGIHNSRSRLIKIDESGSVVWERNADTHDFSIAHPHPQRAGRFVNAPDGGFVLVYSEGPALFVTGTTVKKFDHLGNLEWDSTYYQTTEMFPGSLWAGRHVVSCVDGGYVSIGGGEMGLHSCLGTTMTALRISASGQRQWQVSAASPEEWYATGECVFTCPGNTILGGEITQRLPSDEVLGDLYLVKVDDTGSIVWMQRHEREGFQAVTFGIPTVGEGGCLIGREALSASVRYVGLGPGCPVETLVFESSDGLMCRFDDTGEVLWCRAYGGVGEDCLHSGAQLKDGGFVLVGSTESFGAQEKDFYIIKTDGVGNSSGSP